MAQRILSMLILGIFLMQTVGCGTIIYPERKGQIDGQLDVGIAVADGIGLLFFLVPGVIAYAVDFSNGTIYLPKGEHNNKVIHKRFSLNDVDVIKVADGKVDNAVIEKTLEARVGHPVDMSQVQVLANNQ